MFSVYDIIIRFYACTWFSDQITFSVLNYVLRFFKHVLAESYVFYSRIVSYFLLWFMNFQSAFL